MEFLSCFIFGILIGYLLSFLEHNFFGPKFKFFAYIPLALCCVMLEHFCHYQVTYLYLSLIFYILNDLIFLSLNENIVPKYGLVLLAIMHHVTLFLGFISIFIEIFLFFDSIFI